MISFTANDLSTKAFKTIGFLAQGQVADADDALNGFNALNDMLDAWAAQKLTIFQTIGYVHPLVANQGSPTNPYTIGVGGDFNQVRPLWIPNATIQVGTTSPPFEYDLNILRDASWARTSIKALTASMPKDLYYNYRFDTTGADVGLGELFLYPVPNGTLPLSLVLYTPVPLTAFADQTATAYTFPPGYAEALRYQLAKRLAIEYNREITPALQEMAISTFGIIEKSNQILTPLLRVDRALLASGGIYNWRTGTSGRGDAR